MPSWASGLVNSRADVATISAAASSIRCRRPSLRIFFVSGACGQVCRIWVSRVFSTASISPSGAARVIRPSSAASAALNVSPVR